MSELAIWVLPSSLFQRTMLLRVSPILVKVDLCSIGKTVVHVAEVSIWPKYSDVMLGRL